MMRSRTAFLIIFVLSLFASFSAKAAPEADDSFANAVALKHVPYHKISSSLKAFLGPHAKHNGSGVDLLPMHGWMGGKFQYPTYLINQQLFFFSKGLRLVTFCKAFDCRDFYAVALNKKAEVLGVAINYDNTCVLPGDEFEFDNPLVCHSKLRKWLLLARHRPQGAEVEKLLLQWLEESRADSYEDTKSATVYMYLGK